MHDKGERGELGEVPQHGSAHITGRDALCSRETSRISGASACSAVPDRFRSAKSHSTTRNLRGPTAACACSESFPSQSQAVLALHRTGDDEGLVGKASAPLFTPFGSKITLTCAGGTNPRIAGKQGIDYLFGVRPVAVVNWRGDAAFRSPRAGPSRQISRSSF